MYSPVEQEALSLRSYLPMKIMSPQMSHTECHTNVFWSDITNNRATQYDLALRLLHFDMYYSQHYITWRLLLIWTSSMLCLVNPTEQLAVSRARSTLNWTSRSNAWVIMLHTLWLNPGDKRVWTSPTSMNEALSCIDCLY